MPIKFKLFYFKKKKAILAFFFLLSFQISLSQNSTFHLDTVINLKNIPITFSDPSQVVSTKYIGDIVYISYIKGNKFIQYEYNKNTKKIRINTFKLKNKFSINTVPKDFVIQDNLLYVLIERRIYCLSRIKLKEIYSFKIVGNAEYIFISNEQLITGFYYNYHPLSSPHKAGLRKFDLKGKLLDSIFINVPFPEYTHYLPRELITFNDKKFVFPLFNGLNFILVDINFKDIDTLSLSINEFDSNWVLPSISLSKSIEEHRDDLSLYWSILDNSNYHKISRIEYVKFLDSNKLFIRWYSYDSTYKYCKRYTLLLLKEGNNWSHSKTGVNIETKIPFNTNLKLFEGGMPLLSQNCPTLYSNSNIYQIKIDIPYIENITYKDYYNKKNEMVKKLDPVFSLWIFKYD